MDYSDAIIRRLRDRLLRYRSHTRISGRKRPWNRIAQDVADAESVPRAFYDKEDDFDVLGEALRRFGAATQVPTLERLDAITAFLTEKGYLAADELQEADAPTQLIHSLAQFLGSRDDGLIPDTVLLCGRFLAEREDRRGRHEYRMLAIAQSGNRDFQVEETSYITAMRARSRHPAELRRFFKVASSAVIRNDGWLVHGRNKQVLILIKDRLTGDAELRSVVYAVPSNTDAGADALYLLKHGELGIPVRSTWVGKTPAPDQPSDADIVTEWATENSLRFDRQESG